MFGVGYPLMVPAALAGMPIEPFLLATVVFGQLGGAALTAPFFALIHLPLELGGSPRDVATGMAVLALVSVPFRVVVGRLYEWSGRSVLVVALFHTVFNATNNGTLLRAAAPDQPTLVSVVPWVVVGLGALAVTVSVLRRSRTR